ncbi:MAG: hypothetical protein ACE5OQ_11485 [Woeseia sp.]
MSGDKRGREVPEFDDSPNFTIGLRRFDGQLGAACGWSTQPGKLFDGG